MTLPTELTLMVLRNCDGPIIVACKRVSKAFKLMTETDTALKRATFGRLPLNVMIRILQYLASRQHYTGWLRSEAGHQGGGLHLIPLEVLNKTYNRLLHHHMTIMPILFRGGQVYDSLEGAKVRARDIEIHPVMGRIDCRLHDDLANVHLSVYRKNKNAIEYLVDIPAVDEYLTKPALSSVYWEGAIKNSNGVTVRDLMEKLGSLPTNEYRLWEGVYVVGTRNDCPILEAWTGS